MVHDVDPRVYVINEEVLAELGKQNEKPNLSITTFQDPPFPVTGQIFTHKGLFIPLTCQRARKPDSPIINVWFQIDTGSNETYLSKKAFEALCAPGEPLAFCYVYLQYPNYTVQCKYDEKYEEMNVLGLDVLYHLKISNMNFDYNQMEFFLSKN